MATSNSYFSTSNYHFLPPSTTSPTFPTPPDPLEFNESDIFNPPSSPDFRTSMTSKKILNRKKYSSPASKVVVSGGGSASVPVNVPDWSKILKEEYGGGGKRWSGDNEDDDESEDDDIGGSGGRIPPHEFLARTRMASFSVHEGIGRTLKGRDLSRVRNAIWEKTGFQD